MYLMECMFRYNQYMGKAETASSIRHLHLYLVHVNSKNPDATLACKHCQFYQNR